MTIDYSPTITNIPKFVPAYYSRTSSTDTNVDSGLSQVGFEKYNQLSRLIHSLFEQSISDYDEEELGALSPTSEAKSFIDELLREVYISLGDDFIVGWPITTFDGGIRIEWDRSNDSVALMVPPTVSLGGYIFYEFGNDYYTIPITAKDLTEKLRQLIEK